MNRRNIFITGATGKIGNALINAIGVLRHNTFILCREKSTFPRGTFHRVQGDLCQPPSYADVFQNGIDTVIHLAAITHTNHTARYHDVNVEATKKLIHLCVQHHVNQFIFASTCAASPQGGDYGRSKFQAEEYLKASPLKWIILRMAEVYGFDSREGLDGLFNRIKAMPLIPIIGNGRYRLAPVHISDIVSAFLNVLEQPDLKNMTYILAGPEHLTYNELIDKLMMISNTSRIKIHIPVSLASFLLTLYAQIHQDRHTLVMDQVPRLISQKNYDGSAARRDLGFHPRSMEEMLSCKNKTEYP